MSGKWSSQPISGYVRLTDGTIAQIKRAVIDKATQATHEIVAAVPGKKICVVSMFYLAAGTVEATWKSASTVVTGGLQHTASTGVVLNENPDGWFETATGEALNLTLAQAISVDGALSYFEK